ncbi:pyridoxamine 5'-phosphate oxidase [Actinomadura sp. NAK00032]|uniref:pyridoxamine 5'-phosphate oxidase family protein n=1 Tax=Actinomadura sp. NAK00032 TaxID=2742128 RepID=UPI001592278B|nr:pyridoxamine 5'-phosphate oxidase family protein [Actinomadura sp. NAK00032]QKW39997.1 pyridoxamine 5'-phosphate oxidase [Actinomadura sp. NAK00032]
MVVEGSRPETALLREFVAVAHRVVWCSLATVDRLGRPRSRVVHPYWELTGDDLTGWAFTRPASPKVAHIGHRPYVSCSYWDPAQEVAVAECAAEFAGDAGTRRKVWDLFEAAEHPLGFDPRVLGAAGPLDEQITVLKMTPWRLSTLNGSWRKPDGTK